MTKFDKLLFYLCFSATFLSGMVIYILDNYFKIKTTWGIDSHPALSICKSIHNLLTPVLVFVLGYLTFSHILPRLKITRKLRGRKSGILLVVSFLTLVFTGQLNLVLGNEKVLETIGEIHFIVGVAIIPMLLFHLKRISKSSISI